MTAHSVSTPEQLSAVLKFAEAGDIIECAPGRYGTIRPAAQFSDYVLITSADPENRAKFDGVRFEGAAYIDLRGVHVDNPSNGVRGSSVVDIDEKSHHILVTENEINGKVDAPVNWEDFDGHYGVNVDGDHCRIEGNYIHDVRFGLVAIGPDDVEVVGNRFDLLGADSMKFGSNNGVLIENNIGPATIVRSKTAHVDFIQFQSAARNITIRRNAYLSGNINTSQGIFMADAAYNHVLIEENIIYTGSIHGITVYEGSDVTIRNNRILHDPTHGHKATIIRAPAGAKLSGNIKTTSSKNAGEIGGDLVLNTRASANPFYEAKHIVNSRVGPGAKLADLAAKAGSPAANYGADAFLASLISGDPMPEPAPPMPPEEQPAPKPEPDPSAGEEPEPPMPAPEPPVDTESGLNDTQRQEVVAIVAAAMRGGAQSLEG